MLPAKKSLGQNFLVNPHIIDKIVSAAKLTKEDTVLEVGPGTGILTRKLAEKAGRVIAIEKDRRLIESLKETFKNSGNVEIIEADILKIRNTEFVTRNTRYKIVANIPYYITSNFLRVALEEWPRPELLVLTIQKEVAQRITAKPPHMNLLALSVQYYSDPEIVGFISKNNFRPVPKVDSAIIRLELRITNYELRDTEQREKLFELMRVGFSEKRKQLAPVLSKKLKLPKEKIVLALENIGISPMARAENLSLEQWLKLAALVG